MRLRPLFAHVGRRALVAACSSSPRRLRRPTTAGEPTSAHAWLWADETEEGDARDPRRPLPPEDHAIPAPPVLGRRDGREAPRATRACNTRSPPRRERRHASAWCHASHPPVSADTPLGGDARRGARGRTRRNAAPDADKIRAASRTAAGAGRLHASAARREEERRGLLVSSRAARSNVHATPLERAHTPSSSELVKYLNEGFSRARLSTESTVVFGGLRGRERPRDSDASPTRHGQVDHGDAGLVLSLLDEDHRLGVPTNSALLPLTP